MTANLRMNLSTLLCHCLKMPTVRSPSLLWGRSCLQAPSWEKKQKRNWRLNKVCYKSEFGINNWMSVRHPSGDSDFFRFCLWRGRNVKCSSIHLSNKFTHFVCLMSAGKKSLLGVTNTENSAQGKSGVEHQGSRLIPFCPGIFYRKFEAYSEAKRYILHCQYQ